MPRSPTNSLILTNLDASLEGNPEILARDLSYGNFNVELVSLPRFGRIIIICMSAADATSVRDYLTEKLEIKALMSFSIRDNNLRLLDDSLWAVETNDVHFLELPLEDGSRRFLILPPLSPHSEWNDFDKAEEGPNKKAVYSPNELTHLLWDRLGGFASSHVRKYQYDENASDHESDLTEIRGCEDTVFDLENKPEILFQDIENGAPAIVIDRVNNQEKAGPGVLPKTAIPPPLL
ncbi:hypothetical protein METBIDRAFT_47367 [Metschnikowia bicuspidata var. bicuspidata NRRL YB-4993]|uniref:Calcipressin n=1 Tax=Metschnikowia bicuspidata var. bicuspidata NRRL YB-4993 TaxID=869754 RepID=A0A1A0H553_9ASCO|nr:hypothetical protein METBIDRAFT_47367 [Metschnikowia bicuspidata var. bicuspidata NRRL YB-4993]OBA19037.1 hypothetical protein METBIDRAFT_47367 [Metschnikowia bicuspidata var. bicuspidata NRRL YB-4993]